MGQSLARNIRDNGALDILGGFGAQFHLKLTGGRALSTFHPITSPHHIEVANGAGGVETASVEINHSIPVLPPIGKQKWYPALTSAVLHAQEREEPVDRPRIDWKLITDLPVRSHQEAVEKLHWYTLRWKIETFHKILKFGCRAEQVRLRTAERLVRLIAVFCVLSWRCSG